METEVTQNSDVSTKQRKRQIFRGESVIASLGFAFVVLLTLTLFTSVFWVVRQENREHVSERLDEIRNLGQLLAQSSEGFLVAENYTGVRRLVGDAARSYDLITCRLELPNGQVLADAQPARINLKTLPEVWPEGKTHTEIDLQVSEDMVEAQFPVIIPGRGPATLRLGASLVSATGVSWELVSGIGVIGVVSMLGMLVVYRKIRNRTQAMSAIREALLALSDGETEESLLKVNAMLGSEAEAWNHLLQEHEQKIEGQLSEDVTQILGNRRESGGQLDNLCDAMSSGLIKVDQDFIVQYANGAGGVFLKTKQEELIYQDIRNFIQNETVLEALNDAVDGQKRRRSVLELKQEDSEGILRFNIRPLRKSDHGAILIIIDDVTQQRVADEARNSFVAHATHELRTPLTNIRLYVETALEDETNDPTLRSKCLNVINTETRRLERLVNDMLSVSEMEAGSMNLQVNDVDLDSLFKQLKDDYEAQAKEKNIKLTFNIAPKLPKIQGDREKLAMSMHNLISNALKYTSEQGSVIVSLNTNENQVVAEVSDTGIGMSAEDAEHVFDKFYRAKDKRIKKITGTGLGLALAREMIRLHGGDITLQTELDKGSTFTVEIPLLLPQVV